MINGPTTPTGTNSNCFLFNLKLCSPHITMFNSIFKWIEIYQLYIFNYQVKLLYTLLDSNCNIIISYSNVNHSQSWWKLFHLHLSCIWWYGLNLLFNLCRKSFATDCEAAGGDAVEMWNSDHIIKMHQFERIITDDKFLLSWLQVGVNCYTSYWNFLVLHC